MLHSNSFILQPSSIVLGVTWSNPNDIRKIPVLPYDLPQSCVMSGNSVLKNGEMVGDYCPNLLVSPGDEVSVTHTNKHLMFYKNKQHHYTWDVQIPAPVWGVVGLLSVDKISIEGGE